MESSASALSAFEDCAGLSDLLDRGTPFTVPPGWGLFCSDLPWPECSVEAVLRPDAVIPTGQPTRELLEVSLERWVMRNCPPVTKTRTLLLYELPMPAGRDALHEWASRWNGQARNGEAKLRPEDLGDVWEGLPPDTYLDLALERRTRHGSVWLLGPLGPIEAHERWGNIRRPADPILRTTELPGGAGAMRQLGAALRRWYVKDWQGQSARGLGRPAGTSYWTTADAFEDNVRVAVAEWWKQHPRAKTRPNQAQIARALDVSPSTFKKHLATFGLQGKWEELRRRPN